jgi:hypothetical protein
VVLAYAESSISTGWDLLEMNQIVTGRTVTVIVKLETVSAQSCVENKSNVTI